MPQAAADALAARQQGLQKKNKARQAEAANPQTERSTAALAPKAVSERTPPPPQGKLTDSQQQAYVKACFAGLDLDAAVLDQAKPYQFNNARNAFSSDPMRKAPAEQKIAADWALSQAGGDLTQFASNYEYAIQRYKRVAAANAQAGQQPKRGDAAPAKKSPLLSAEALSVSLAADVHALQSRPVGDSLAGPTAGMRVREIGLAVQGLGNVAFADAVREAYHALKHEGEILAGFDRGNVFDTHQAIAMHTIRTGEVMDTPPDPTHSASTRIVIHQRYGSNPKNWREAVIWVSPDGRATLASWGKCKVVRRDENGDPVTRQTPTDSTSSTTVQVIEDTKRRSRDAADARKQASRQAAADEAASVASLDSPSVIEHRRQTASAADQQRAKDDQLDKSNQSAKDDQDAKSNQAAKIDKAGHRDSDPDGSGDGA